MGQISSAALITPKTSLGTVQIARKQKEMNNARAHGGSQEASGALEVAFATKTIRVMFVSVHVALRRLGIFSLPNLPKRQKHVSVLAC